MTRHGAGCVLALALGLDRLPLTGAALAAGLIDERRAAVITDELSGLDDEHAAAVEALIIGKAAGQTTGQLRPAVRRAVIAADPAAAKRRKEEALKDARVEASSQPSGTATLAGRDLPPAGVLAADKHLTALAQAMKKAGAEGTMDLLRARAYLHLLAGQPAETLLSPAAGTAGTGTLDTGTAGTAGTGTAGTGTLDTGTAGTGSPGTGTAGTGTAARGTAGARTAGPGAVGLGLPALCGTGRLCRCSISSGSARRPVRSRAAAAPPRAVTSTIPSLTTEAAAPAGVTSPRSAGATMRRSKPPAGH